MAVPLGSGKLGGRRPWRVLVPVLALTLAMPTIAAADSAGIAGAASQSGSPANSASPPISSSTTSTVPSSTTSTVPSSTTSTVPSSTTSTVPSSTTTTVPSSTTTPAPSPAATTPSTQPKSSSTAAPANSRTKPQATAPACTEANAPYTSPCGPTYTLPQWSDDSGWDKPSSYGTIQLANLEGQGDDDLLGRDANGLWVEQFDSATGQWELQANPEGGLALDLTSQAGWNQPQYYETIQTGDITGNGISYLLARGSDGLHTLKWNAATDTFVSAGPVLTFLSDGNGWNQPRYYQTIHTADITGDGQAYLLARGPAGLYTFQWGANGWSQVGPVLTALSDAACSLPGCYKTIQTGDVTGDGQPDLLARTADGLRAYEWKGPQTGWVQVGGLLEISDAQGWNHPQYYETIQTANLDGTGKADVLARGSAGLHVFQWTPTGWQELGQALTALSDANGFNKAQSYKTIQTADLDGDGKDELLARNAQGIAVYQWNGPQAGWSSLSGNALSLSDPLWSAPAYYETIHTGDIAGTDKAYLLARGPFGIRTFQWDPTTKTFTRPLPYGDFPSFTGPEAAAYAALGQFLLDRPVDFRKATYASPSNAITADQLLSYRIRLAERCTPVAVATGTAPPTYTDCRPPAGTSVSPVAWTAVSNQIIAELWAAQGVVAYFTTLETIELKLFQDQQGTLPALDAAFNLPPNPPDRGPFYVKLVKDAIEIVSDVALFFPAARAYVITFRAIALTAHALSAVGHALPLANAPSPPESYAQITHTLATIQQQERDITEANRRYVLADYGLLMTVGSLVNGRVLTLDSTAMLSAGRQAFTQWIYELYAPAYWQRYDVVNCYSVPLTQSCEAPVGPTVRIVGKDHFLGVLQNTSKCTTYIVRNECIFNLPQSNILDRIVGPISTQCQYDPAPGSNAAWRYGCNLGMNPNEMIDNHPPWHFSTRVCDLRRRYPPPDDLFSLCHTA